MTIDIATTDFAMAITYDLCDQSYVLSTIWPWFQHFPVTGPTWWSPGQNLSQQGRTSCSKPVTPGLRPGYDVAATKTIWNRRQIVERTHDWSHRSWVIARANQSQQGRWSCSKLLTCDSKSFRATIDRAIGRNSQRLIVRSVARWCYDWSCDRSLNNTIDRTIGLRVQRLIVRSVTGCHECSYDRSHDATIARTTGRRMQRSIDRSIGRRPSRLIVHRSLIATTSRTISYDGSCHRYSPIVRDSATPREIDRGMRPLLEIVANIADRSHLAQSQPIVRSSNRTIRCGCGLRPLSIVIVDILHCP